MAALCAETFMGGNTIYCHKLENGYNNNMLEYTIILFWDEEASVWVAESQDLPGLILESDSFDTLVERVKIAVPDLLELGGTDHGQVKLHFKAERLAVVA